MLDWYPKARRAFVHCELGLCIVRTRVLTGSKWIRRQTWEGLAGAVCQPAYIDMFQ